MIIRFGLLKKNPALSDEAFRDHWINVHGPLARQLPGLRAYRQNHVVDSRQLGIAYQRGPWHFDGFSQLWFESDESMRSGLGSDLGPKLAADEATFIGELHVVSAEQMTVIQPPKSPQGVLKRMSLLTRLDRVSDERFRHEWGIVHADHVKRMLNVRGYRQNHIVHRERVKGTPCTREELPIDGIVELWFENIPTIEASFGSPAGQATMAHARTFLSEITTFLIEDHVIV